ncbi:MAG: winged helix-turn-helix transcriptional regulator [Lachnospiraceae bacterium]|nr:winged helix-turn-helix transcriptional regulator [Lachnospiraceae bacterium]
MIISSSRPGKPGHVDKIILNPCLVQFPTLLHNVPYACKHRHCLALDKEISPKVEYSLTELGESFIPVLQTMMSWSETYLCPDYQNPYEK